jgi:hypothetical protein
MYKNILQAKRFVIPPIDETKNDINILPEGHLPGFLGIDPVIKF